MTSPDCTTVVHVGSHAYTREEIAATPGGFAAIFNARVAAAYRQVGDEANAKRADACARKHADRAVQS